MFLHSCLLYHSTGWHGLRFDVMLNVMNIMYFKCVCTSKFVYWLDGLTGDMGPSLLLLLLLRCREFMYSCA